MRGPPGSRPNTILGTIDLEIPKLRRGTYYPAWLLERGRRAEKALVAVITESYVLGVSTRKVEDLVKQLGVEQVSKSQVSELAKELDETVRSFRERPLDAGPYAYVWLDALVVKCREGGRIVNVASSGEAATMRPSQAVITTGAGEELRRETTNSYRETTPASIPAALRILACFVVKCTRKRFQSRRP